MDPLVVRRLAARRRARQAEQRRLRDDYNEVSCWVGDVHRAQPAQTDTSRFFSANSATTVGDALVRYLEANPVSLDHIVWTFRGRCTGR